MYNVCIIGAGVIGTAIARELSKYNLNILLLEKAEDVGNGATKANSGIVHGGYTAKNGTLKGSLSISGNRMFKELQKELNFEYKQIGSLVLAFEESELPLLEELQRNGESNGVNGLEIIGSDEIQKREPNVSEAAVAALFCPETGIVSPYEFCIALAENAVQNGVDLKLQSRVKKITKEESAFTIETVENLYQAELVINAAGVYSDKIAQMVGDMSIEIIPRKGEYIVFQRGQGEFINSVVFQVPSKRGKGVLVTPTCWNNLMIGPNSEEIPAPDDTSTNVERLKYIVRTAKKSVPDFDLQKMIRTFSGIRATEKSRDFVIRQSEVSGFVHAAGIDSPGLTSAPAIAEKVVEICGEAGLVLKKKKSFHKNRKAITRYSKLKPFSEVKDLISLEEGVSHRIVCRCEQVSEGTIVDALHRGIAVNSLDAVKRRTRAGMGACQGEFCGSRVKKLIARETGLSEAEVFTKGEGEDVLAKRVDPTSYKSLLEDE
ncbi:MAG: NAD(P)/FAD-dependent oxidoreductase [Spirochaetia bacterium]